MAHATERLHPGAWWLWALALATAATRVTNPWLLIMIVGVAGSVVAACRGNEPWARSYGLFLRFALIVVAIRVIFHILLGGAAGSTVLFSLPQVPLPDWVAGIRLGGPVTAEGALAALYDGMSLATMLCCIGAANALANTKRLLRCLPAALYEVSVAVTVALSVAPQLVVSAQRTYRARALRGDTQRGLRAIRRVLVPVLVDALENSLALAASMDSRGYGRTSDMRRGARRRTAVLLSGLVGVCFGVYGLLDATADPMLAAGVLVIGAILALSGLRFAAVRIQRTTYRPDRFRSRELLIAASGIAAVVAVIAAELGGVEELTPSASLLGPPAVPLLPTIGILIALLPIWIAPRPVLVTPRPHVQEVGA